MKTRQRNIEDRMRMTTLKWNCKVEIKVETFSGLKNNVIYKHGKHKISNIIN